VPELTDGGQRPWSARLFYAYADVLLDDGREEEAREWFGRAAALDTDEDTDAAERYEDLDNVFIDDLAEPESGEETDTDSGPEHAAGQQLEPGDEQEDADPGDAQEDADPGDEHPGDRDAAASRDEDAKQDDGDGRDDGDEHEDGADQDDGEE
jgi:hypothetical protein